MNFWRRLLLPWQVTGRIARWAALVLGVAAVLGASAFVLFSHQNDVWVRAAGIVGLAQAMVWMFMTNVVLITIDAHQLRLPGITRHVVLGVAINIVLAVLLPALLIGASAGHGFAVAVIIALLSMAGLLHNLLPRYVGLVLFGAWLMVIMNWAAILRSIRADFVLWALPALALVVAAVAVCWRGLVITAKPPQVSRNSPPALRLGRMLATASGGRRAAQRFDGRAGWFQTRVDLRDCGPGHPVQSLRMALGGAGTPQNFMGWLRKSVGIVFSLAMLILWLLVLGLRGQDVVGGVESGGTMALLGVVAGICVMQVVTSSTYLTARWRQVNAELPLLALLPKLGNHVKRDVLRAVLWPAMRVLLVATLLVLVVVARVRQQAIDIFSVLVIVTAAAQVIAFSLHVVGDGRRHARDSRVAGILGLVLFFLGVTAVVLWSHPGNAPPLLGVLWQVLFAGWLIEVVMLFRVGYRGWRGLQRRPHPFLVN